MFGNLRLMLYSVLDNKPIASFVPQIKPLKLGHYCRYISFQRNLLDEVRL